MKICPECEEPLKDDAIVCTHCGHQLAPIPVVADSGRRPTPDYIKAGCGLLGLLTVVALFLAFNQFYQRQ